MSVITEEWLEARVVATKAAIEATEAALIALASGAQSYTLDTGQTRQVVQKADVASLRLNLQALYNLLQWQETQLCGTGAVRVIPGF
jgi:pyridoxine 5'-phosphate synthase PdxJ